MIIDFHYHHLDTEGLLDNLLAEMNRAGIDKTSICAIEDLHWMGNTVGTNEKVYKAVSRFPDRIVGCVYIDPRRPDACSIVDDYAGRGFRCVKMFPPAGFYPDDEKYFHVYERIAKHGLPILFHTGQTGLVYADSTGRRATDSFCAHPMRLDKVAKAFPEIPVVVAHMGYPHYMEAWSMAWVNPNLYLDFAGIGPEPLDNPWIASAPLVYNAIGKCIAIDFKRVIWGSDNCCRQKESMEIARNYLSQMGCSQEDFRYVFGETARKLLKL